MVENSPLTDGDGIFNREWAELLVEQAVFSGDPSTWSITRENFK